MPHVQSNTSFNPFNIYNHNMKHSMAAYDDVYLSDYNLNFKHSTPSKKRPATKLPGANSAEPNPFGLHAYATTHSMAAYDDVYKSDYYITSKSKDIPATIPAATPTKRNPFELHAYATTHSMAAYDEVYQSDYYIIPKNITKETKLQKLYGRFIRNLYVTA